MVDFRLSEEQEALRASVREFAREQIAPVIAEHYEKHTFPYDIVQQMVNARARERNYGTSSEYGAEASRTNHHAGPSD